MNLKLIHQLLRQFILPDCIFLLNNPPFFPLIIQIQPVGLTMLCLYFQNPLSLLHFGDRSQYLYLFTLTCLFFFMVCLCQFLQHTPDCFFQQSQTNLKIRTASATHTAIIILLFNCTFKAHTLPTVAALYFSL